MRISPAQKIDQVTFRQIFIDNWPGFKGEHPSYGKAQYDEVVQKMLGCGKEEGGYTEYMCMHCGRDRRRVCFTCKSSFCLSCAKGYVDDFVVQVSKMLHPGVIYRHVILTVPEQLRINFYQARHDGAFLSAFMRCGYECLEAAVRQVKRQSLKIGTIIVVQTHGRSGRYNPHLHMMLTSGGINEETGKWVDLTYFPYEILRKKWQYHLLGLLKGMIPTEEMGDLIDDLWGRMVQHILPKGYQRVRYYGLESTRSFSKWGEIIRTGLKCIGRTIKGAYQVLANKRYRKRYLEISGHDPLICKYCGNEMELSRIWHPKYGVIYDELDEIKAGKYEPAGEDNPGGRYPVRSSAGVLQLSLFPLPA